ncbi:ImmA/IrrE family metallo-endopeptidase [Microbacterium invictum]|uniref:ImmA/IrrE family metallo-endopeptidase n=1 Tax=Microbacterium invictum TaxID=515415 RepID=A0ABZ0VBN4_9MICO|nr:ImmA/IrrE family metallo-endopeptidase [Microbacterium invictum]WQB71051.1 ImmA/IrrE family metallo-endopeptidase [Microbacterium invictum]
MSAVQRRRGRPLRIVELADLSDRDGICALWLVRDTEDLVIHARSESTLHRQQFVLHELAHIILDHGRDDAADCADPLLPDIAPSTRRRLLRRQDLVTADEIAAESLADHLAAAIRGSVMHESRFLEIFG